jgi:Zn-dependent peptidase ImmA (M78 family)
VIFIKPGLNTNHEEFYLRHELGHALLHTHVIHSGFCNVGKLERQANYFAFELSNIKIDEVELRDMTIDQIASVLELPHEPLKQLVNA